MRKLLQMLKRLSKRLKGLSKLYTSGRSELEPVLMRLLDPDYRVKISADRTSADMLQYIDTGLQICLENGLLKLVDPSIVLRISEALEGSSEGMYVSFLIMFNHLVNHQLRLFPYLLSI